MKKATTRIYGFLCLNFEGPCFTFGEKLICCDSLIFFRGHPVTGEHHEHGDDKVPTHPQVCN